jgi:general stress protein CsbA
MMEMEMEMMMTVMKLVLATVLMVLVVLVQYWGYQRYVAARLPVILIRLGCPSRFRPCFLP